MKQATTIKTTLLYDGFLFRILARLPAKLYDSISGEIPPQKYRIMNVCRLTMCVHMCTVVSPLWQVSLLFDFQKA